MSDTDKTMIGKGIYPHPDCMAPDGADPCAGYHSALKRVAELEAENSGLLAAAESLAADVYTKESE